MEKKRTEPGEEFMRSLILGAQVHAKPCEHHRNCLGRWRVCAMATNQLAHMLRMLQEWQVSRVCKMLRLTKETWHLVKEN